ncbi:hypothetical protein SAMN04515674_11549 [Pseudarcicella hirudinis]|uniref:Antitoxin component YwqK of the YwqJK toxin-antitoxin module n=1 Tax=Pseudarcicella hirudinis TaxID=1079859 RepID=A0A1I5XLG6_9BACT|nr:hypothetical protein [Pseudarcicella hirudinis]SFQ32778.1 hypothetical protein SAMN04515674_11549 [Pseudarcicella hirudinis]
MRSLSFFLITACILIGQSNVKAQSDEFKTKEKPKTDTSAKSKGFLGGLIQSDILDNLKKNKDEAIRIKKGVADLYSDITSTDLGLKIKQKKSKAKTRKVPKDEYEGIKMERRIGSYGNGNRATVEEINVLKYTDDEKRVSPYAKEIWWYDYKLARIVNTPVKDKNYAQICHGPYRKYINDELVEEGFFYAGAKDGRWETYNQEYILLNKQKYKRGQPADARISYYDKEETKIKEVIPVNFGKITGDYRAFYEEGQLQEEGRFDDSVKVGKWREYHQFGVGGRLKKEVQYGKDKFDKSEPFVLQERDTKGKITYEAPKAKKKEEVEDEN